MSTVTIPEGGVGFSNLGGTYIEIVQSYGPVLVIIDQTEPRELLANQGFRVAGGFERLTFRTPDGRAAVIRIWAGDDEFINRRQEQISAPSIMSPWEGNAVASNQTVPFTGALDGDRIRRESITISNMSPEGNLLLVNQAGLTWGVVRPGETITHRTSEYVGVKNTAAYAISAIIGENWWLIY